jgi:MSHA biogenesis protein MshK
MISPTQSSAIINGVTVRLGEKYGDAVLVRVAESEVVLKSGSAQQVLKIHPGVDKHGIAATKGDSKSPADAAAPARQGAQP